LVIWTFGFDSGFGYWVSDFLLRLLLKIHPLACNALPRRYNARLFTAN